MLCTRIRRTYLSLLYSAFFVLLATLLLGCAPAEDAGIDRPYSIAVFVPGVVEGSPTYEMLVEGVRRAVDESEHATVRIVEGGFNQAEWAGGITSLAATGSYDLIVSSNPSLPEIVHEVSQSFPDQHFLVLDGYWEGNPRLRTVMFNQREQAYLNGYFAGLVTTGGMPDSTNALRIGLLAGQEYPMMNQVIRPAFLEGAQAVNTGIELDFRVLGNWFDAGRAADLANSMLDRGVDVILSIAGGGNQGVIATARDRNAYVLWFDSSGFHHGPGVVIGSSLVKLDQAAYERTLEAIAGSLEFGVGEVLGVADGYVTFDDQDPNYIEYVPEDVRTRHEALMQRLMDQPMEFAIPGAN
ncbi:MAG: BMP family ABC transporter substrate-binding protein [Spirochaetaceae bacterium]|nr:MAG: BMP family ABC transporter substrate-binding protein [Spirochaetaceae bacterium]